MGEIIGLVLQSFERLNVYIKTLELCPAHGMCLLYLAGHTHRYKSRHTHTLPSSCILFDVVVQNLTPPFLSSGTPHPLTTQGVEESPVWLMFGDFLVFYFFPKESWKQSWTFSSLQMSGNLERKPHLAVISLRVRDLISCSL